MDAENEKKMPLDDEAKSQPTENQDDSTAELQELGGSDAQSKTAGLGERGGGDAMSKGVAGEDSAGSSSECEPPIMVEGDEGMPNW